MDGARLHQIVHARATSQLWAIMTVTPETWATTTDMAMQNRHAIISMGTQQYRILPVFSSGLALDFAI